MDLLTIANELEKKIKEIDNIRGSLRERGELKATTIAEYEKKIAITMIKLKNGFTFEIDGQKIDNPPVTMTEKIARGICWQEKLEMEKAETAYKSVVVNLDAVQTQLSAYQSLNRYLDKF
jgi:glucosamine 6-phosphate synthetase-like amidotransferase/phosphosugar isomerase protein